MFLVVKGRGQNRWDPFRIVASRGGMEIFPVLRQRWNSRAWKSIFSRLVTAQSTEQSQRWWKNGKGRSEGDRSSAGRGISWKESDGNLWRKQELPGWKTTKCPSQHPCTGTGRGMLERKSNWRGWIGRAGNFSFIIEYEGKLWGIVWMETGGRGGSVAAVVVVCPELCCSEERKCHYRERLLYIDLKA